MSSAKNVRLSAAQLTIQELVFMIFWHLKVCWKDIIYATLGHMQLQFVIKAITAALQENLEENQRCWFFVVANMQ